MSQSLQQVNKNEISYVPLGNSDPIKLSLAIIERQIVTPTKSGKKPTQKEMMDFLMLCRARKLNPFEGDAYLVGYDSANGANFSLITSHQALLKRAELCPQFDGMESGLILEDENGLLSETEGDFIQASQNAVGAWARVHRSDRKIATFRRLNIDRYDRGFGLWKKQREMMGVKCAEADALRSAFPSVTGGLYISEEMPPTKNISVAPNLLTESEEDESEFAPSKPIKKHRTSQGKNDNQALTDEPKTPADIEGELLA